MLPPPSLIDSHGEMEHATLYLDLLAHTSSYLCVYCFINCFVNFNLSIVVIISKDILANSHMYTNQKYAD